MTDGQANTLNMHLQNITNQQRAQTLALQDIAKALTLLATMPRPNS